MLWNRSRLTNLNLEASRHRLLHFIDSDHAADLVSRRSRTDVLIYLQSAPIAWYTKKQGSIETSSFGSEFTALKNGY
jgi:hypothetical protein